MKKINSVGYGHKILLAAAFFLIVVPLALYAVYSLFGGGMIPLLIKVSLCIGAAIAVFLAVLLAIELHQDKKINREYKNLRTTKIQISASKYECQACGNQNLREADTYCKVCGIRFK